ncbi:COG4 transport protein-domain-containing protein [Scheffersomyces amazonensis]|uniref:COG4 transport protein-domain-containing protein n=1 Tax=Scheffersomyces amazonensis TaxID=1078765 RepID=UPI00315C6A27
MPAETIDNSNALFPALQESQLDKVVQELYQQYQLANTPNGLYKLIDNIDEEIEQIDKELNYYTKLKQKRFQQDINNIELNRTTKLSSAITNSNELVSIFQSANDLGHSLTFKIKSLDEEIGNVNKTLEFVTNIQLLRNNINQASYAIEHKNYELAAQCISTINSKLSKELINGRFASIVIPSTDIPELPEVTINSWIDKLTEIFKLKFDEAAKARNVEDLTKYFQLFPLINQEEIGLNCYSKFICQIINDTSKNLIISTASVPADDLKAGIFATITMQLFENISMMLSQHGPLIKRYYSSTYPSALNYVITKIQREIDSQIGIIGDTFYDVRRIDKYFQDIKLYNFPVLSKRLNELQDQMHDSNSRPQSQQSQHEFESIDGTLENNNDLVSIVQVGDLINELATIFHHWSLYCKFITIKYFKTSDQDVLKLPDLIIKSNFTKKINNKYLPAFEILYTFYFRRSIEKAITIEELPSLDTYLVSSTNLNEVSKSPEQTPCSSVIEDITLILHNTLRNVIDTSIPSTVKKFISESFKVIQTDLINGFFIKNLNDNQPRYNQTLSLITAPSLLSNGITSSTTVSPGTTRSSTPEPTGMAFLKGAQSALGNVVASGTSGIVGGLQTSSTNNVKLLNFILYLNTVAMGQEYFTKIFNNFIQNGNVLNNSFPFGKDHEKIETILRSDFLDPFLSITNKIISDSIINLYNQSLKNKLVILINDLLPESNDSAYIIYTSTDLNDTSALLKFSTAWQSLIRPYIQTCHKSIILNKLLRLLVVNFANLIEKKLLSILKKFKINELGSIKLEKDLSYLINEVCNDNYQLREKFVRVTQMVLLIGMDDEEYEESIQHINQTTNGSKNSHNGNTNDIGTTEPIKKEIHNGSTIDEEDDEEDDVIGINWVLTPQERKQIRRYRV